jgi:hypothetical protein
MMIENNMNNSPVHPLKEQIKLGKAIKQTLQACKKGKEALLSVSLQSIFVYGAMLLLLQALFGDASISSLLENINKSSPTELNQYAVFNIVIAVARSVIEWLLPYLVEASMVVYLCRRFLEHDQRLGEVIDLTFKVREVKLFGIFMILAAIWAVCSVFFALLLAFTKEIFNQSEKGYQIADILKITALSVGAGAAFYCNLRLVLSSFLGALDAKKAFKYSWQLTKNKVWFFALFISLLYIPYALLNVIRGVFLQVASSVPLLQNSWIASSFNIITEILNLIVRVIPFYMGVITVYSHISSSPHKNQVEEQISQNDLL